MSNRTAAILAEAKQLPAEDLADLIDELIVTSFEQPAPEIEAAWVEEIKRRVAEADAGRGEWIDGEEILRKLREGRCP